MGLLLTVACGGGEDGSFTVAQAISAIAGTLPASWSVAEREEGQVPGGHYWGDWGANYQGPKGTRIVLAGPQPTYFCWQSKSGEWKREPLGRESINVWFMPGDYSQGFWSWVNPHAPARAPLVFAGRTVKLFAQVSGHLFDEDKAKLKEILAGAMAAGCSNGGESERSWLTWREDIARGMEPKQ